MQVSSIIPLHGIFQKQILESPALCHTWGETSMGQTVRGRKVLTPR